MFGESNTQGSIGPNRRGLWVGIMVGCLLLVTGAALVSGTVDGLNFFGGHLADSTPTFSDPPKDDAPPNPPSQPNPQRPDPKPDPKINPQISARLPSPALAVAPVHTPRTTAEPPVRTPCSRPGYAAVIEPAADPIGTALARSLKASDLQTRIIDPGDGILDRQDLDRIMSGDGSPVTGRIKEGTFLVAQLKVQVRQTVIDQATMTEVLGTMDLAIVRNNCGAITVQNHRDVSARSVNETLDDGIRGLGEIFNEKIAELLRKDR